jgi:hypothetical protein
MIMDFDDVAPAPDNVVFAGMASAEPEGVNIGIRIPRDVHAKLVIAARASERSLSGEIRYILRSIAERRELLENP